MFRKVLRRLPCLSGEFMLRLGLETGRSATINAVKKPQVR